MECGHTRPIAMNMSVCKSSAVAAVIAVLAFAYAEVHWSLLDPKVEIVVPSWYAGFRLIAASLVLTYLGHAVCAFSARKWRGLRLLRLSPLARCVVSLVLGQTLCMVWVLLRSGISGGAYLATGYQLPITRVEVVLLLAVIVLVTRQPRKGLEDYSAEKPSRISPWDLLVFSALLALSLTPIALRELPRDIALSSDPDQYTFWASQVLRLGGVPWDQGILGIGSFGYPAGFAVLCAIWCVFSGLSPVEIVTIQPILQFILAALLCAALAEYSLPSRETIKSPASSVHIFLVSSLLLTTYWTVLPYGHQQMMYHGEGGGRGSTSLLMATVLGSVIAAFASPRDRCQRVALVFLLGITGALIATVNPITAVVPCCLIGLICLYELGRSIWAWRSNSVIAVGILPLLALGFVGLFLVLSDPYFTEMIISALLPRVDQTIQTAAAAPLALEFTLPDESILTWLQPTRLCALLVGGAFPPEFFTAQFYIIVSGLFLWWLVKAPGSAIRLTLLLVYLSLSFYLSLAIPQAGDMNRPVYLVQPYIMQSIMQAGPVLGLLLLAIGSLFIIRSLRGWGSLVALVVGVAAVTTPDASLASYNRFLNANSRRTYCGSLGCLSEGDRAALRFVTDLGKDVLSKYSGLTYDEVPKIMILADPHDLGTEDWLFPFGSSRVLPLESPLPVAFFYGRGSPQWNFSNYQRHICARFDLDWLKRRNVRFLFLPANDPGCIRGKSRIIESSTILFERDGTRVLKLF